MRASRAMAKVHGMGSPFRGGARHAGARAVQAVDVLGGLGVIAIAALTFLSVVLRYAFNTGIPWSGEAVRYMFVWVAMIGVLDGIRRDGHFRMDMVLDALPPRVSVVARRVAALTCAVGLVVMARASLSIVDRIAATGQRSPALELPIAAVYAIMPLTLGISALILLAQAWRPPRHTSAPSGDSPALPASGVLGATAAPKADDDSEAG